MLSLLLPEERETDLLGVCLGNDPRGAWQRFLRQVPDPVQYLKQDALGVRRLAPLVLRALERAGIEVSSGIRIALRTARMHEELRTAEYRKICRTVYQALYAGELPFLVLKGAALGPLVYRDPVLRHGHDLDILVRGEDRDRAVGLIRAAGLAPSRQIADSDQEAPAELYHPSGLPVLLHTRLFAIRFHQDPGSALWERAEAVELDGQPAWVLSPADGLLHILGSAAGTHRRGSLAWVADAFLLIDSRADLSWPTLIESVRKAGLSLPAFAMLRYLDQRFGSAVPREALDRLEQNSDEAPPLERDVVLLQVREGRFIPATFRALRGRGWRTRLYWARLLLLPSPAYLQWLRKRRLSSLRLSLNYLQRPLSYLWKAVFRPRLAALTERRREP